MMFKILNIFYVSYGFPEASSSSMLEMIMFHDYTLLIIILIVTITMMVMFFMLTNKFFSRDMLENHYLELIWTILPSVVMFFLAIPSIYLLYMMEGDGLVLMTVKVLGNQWFWSYDYADMSLGLDFDSYMISESGMTSGMRLLEVDNRLVLPINTLIRVIVSSTDVIHSWAVPSLGIKVDAIPGRLNQVSIYLFKPGVFYGQCSEICGVNHSFMPIVVEGVKHSFFINWLMK